VVKSFVFGGQGTGRALGGRLPHPGPSRAQNAFKMRAFRDWQARDLVAHGLYGAAPIFRDSISLGRGGKGLASWAGGIFLPSGLF